MSTLSDIRRTAAKLRSQGMSKPERTRYLRRKGWRSVSTSGTGRWIHPDGRTLTLLQATVAQLLSEAGH